jgi:NADH:ubiquinone oxidoreductase subunit D
MTLISYNKFKFVKSFIINFGPQHPAAHGCFTVSIGVRCGEIVLRCVPHCGFFT